MEDVINILNKQLEICEEVIFLHKSVMLENCNDNLIRTEAKKQMKASYKLKYDCQIAIKILKEFEERI